MPSHRPVHDTIILSDALSLDSDVDELKEEMLSWLNSMPSSMESSAKHDAVSECADDLETGASNLEEPLSEIAHFLRDRLVVGFMDKLLEYWPEKMYGKLTMPRHVRLHNIILAISAALKYLESMRGDIEAITYTNSVSEDSSITMQDFADYCGHIVAVEHSLDNLEQVDFPSMF